jgi:hypothetical protein
MDDDTDAIHPARYYPVRSYEKDIAGGNDEGANDDQAVVDEPAHGKKLLFQQ